MSKNWRVQHRQVIDGFLKQLNSQTDNYVLKGGTALMKCYKLDRFSEDIDLDGIKGEKIEKAVSDFCKKNGFFYRVAKDTPTVKRFFVNYEKSENPRKPLKIEISFRNRQIDSKIHHKINGTEVYDINTLALMKANAYSSRDKVRDLYDVTFICNNYWDELSDTTKNILSDVVLMKGVEQFDYLANNGEPDELIDYDKLAGDFLRMYDKLDIPQEKDIEKETPKAPEMPSQPFYLNPDLSKVKKVTPQEYTPLQPTKTKEKDDIEI